MALATNRSGTGVRRVGVLAVLVALAVAGLPAVAGAQAASLRLPEALPGDRLLLSEHNAEGNQLWSAALDGSDRRSVTGDAGGFAPRWSPDGTLVAFHRVGPSTTEPWVADADGTGARRLAPEGYTPSWSPDGRSVVFATSFAGSPGPLRIAEVGTDALADVPGTEGGIDPRWSPDGRRIAFTTVDEVAPQNAVAVVRPDGGDLRLLPAERITGAPVWSPDGRLAAFAAAPAGQPYGLYTIGRDGTGLRLLARTFGGTVQLSGIDALAWSPAGDRLAFSAEAPDGRSLDVYLVTGDGEQMWHPAPSGADDRVTGWTADGAALVLTRFVTPGLPMSARDAWLLRLADAPATERLTTTERSVAADVGPGRALRVAGQDRIGTAVQLSQLRGAADAVVVARADAYPDALAGAPLAAAVDAPVLLTGSGGLDDRVGEEVRRLGATTAYLLGGEGALSAAVAEGLAAVGVTTVQRLAGPDRFATARRVAEHVVDLTGADRAYVVEGASADPARGWPDAVAVSGLAALEGRPILLVTRDVLPASTSGALADLGLAHATVVGGTGAVSAEVAAALAAAGPEVDRIAGATRYATSAALAAEADVAGADGARVWLTTGRNWPDALAGGPTVAADGGVLLLVDGQGLAGSPATRERLAGVPADRVVLVGGAGVLRPSAAAEVEGLASAAAGLSRVAVHFHVEGEDDPREVVAFDRFVEGPAVLHGAIEALLRGPTGAERRAGHWSWFSEDTAGFLREARIEAGTAHIDFDDFSGVIPNASTSFGSAVLLAQLDATATQFPTVDRALYSFAGDRAAFYEWLQLAVPDG